MFLIAFVLEESARLLPPTAAHHLPTEHRFNAMTCPVIRRSRSISNSDDLYEEVFQPPPDYSSQRIAGKEKLWLD